MLAIPLPEFKRQLEEMLLDLQLLVPALKQLRDSLPEQSEKRVTVLTLLGRLNDANKKALRGTLDNAALQTEYNSIRADLSDFVQGLEEVDFDEHAANNEAASAKATAAKQGNVLYRIPHTMPLRQETECVVRIALDEDAIVEEITIDDQVVLKNLSRVSDLMQVELGDPAKESVFAIRSTSPAQQLITEEGFTQWFFYVEPLREGVHPLEVKVSVLELALNQVHRKELVFRETIQIITEGPAAEESADTAPPSQPQPSASDFKNAGQAFAFEGSSIGLGNYEVSYSEAIALPTEVPPTINNKPSKNSGLRTLALFLGFIMLGSTATWALTPDATFDWWVASIIQDTPTAYASYIEKYPDSPHREKAFFYRAERSQQLADLRAYQREYRQGKFQDKVMAGIASLEVKAIDSIRTRPSRENISRFAMEFPETERLAAVKQAAETRADNRADILKEVENIYVASARRQPTEQKVRAYLRDFPQHDSLGEVAAAAAAKPEVMAKVQGELEEAYLKKMEKNPTPKQAEDFLQQFPEPMKQEAFEKILDKKPAVKKEAVSKMRKAKAMREAQEVEDQKIRN
jgi:hypothetical protein